MHKSFIKGLALLFSICFIFVLSSCAKGPTLDEVRARCEELILASQELQEIINGEGLPVNDTYLTGSDYWFVDTEKSEYDSIEELTAAIDAVYEDNYARNIKDILFVGYNDAIGSLFPRFTEGDYGDLMQYKFTGELPEKTVFDFSGMEMVKSKPESFTVSVPASYDGKTENMEITFSYDTNSGAWLLNSPIY